MLGELHDVVWDVKYGNGRFVAIASRSSTDGVRSASAYVSTDGKNWTSSPLPGSTVGFRIAFGNGLFIGTGVMGLLSSVDGVTWAVDTRWPLVSGVEFAGGTFVSWTARSEFLVGTRTGDWQDADLRSAQGFVTDVRAVNDGFRGVLSVTAVLRRRRTRTLRDAPESAPRAATRGWARQSSARRDVDLVARGRSYERESEATRVHASRHADEDGAIGHEAQPDARGSALNLRGAPTDIATLLPAIASQVARSPMPTSTARDPTLRPLPWNANFQRLRA